MLIDWLLYGLLTWAVASMLNATVFKEKPATRATAWALTAVVFIINLFVLTILQYLRFRVVSRELGVTVHPPGPVDGIGAFVFSGLLFSLLRKSSRVLADSNDLNNLASVAQATVSSSTPAPTLPQTAMTLAKRDDIHIPMSRPTDGSPAEQFWSAALEEMESSARRPGLWARSFSEANGDQAIAKAKYLAYRSSELENEHRESEVRRAQAEANRRRLEELEQLSSAERAYALLPKGTCPNCKTVIPLNAVTCPKCRAEFGPHSGWRVTPISET